MDHEPLSPLSRRLGYYATNELLGAGLPMWLPAGAAVRGELERYIVDEERKAGYEHVYTPPLGRRDLYERSGHLALFGDDMYPPIEVDGEQLMLRPMNCPHHILVYAAEERSYRDLPVRIAELGAMFRNERSGVVGGLGRVRAMTLNDGHVFCGPDQIEDEVDAMLGLIGRAYDELGIVAHRYRLSLRDDRGKYVDDPEMWERAEAMLRAVLERASIAYEEAPGEAAFYGPKLDVQVLDRRGREETLSTVQLDFHLPAQFDLGYIGADGRRHRPVLLHRSIVSTMERMVAHLVDVHDGWLPAWLAPVQVAVLPVGERVASYAGGAARALVEAGIRARLDSRDETLALRIRRSVEQKVPYIAVCGAREASAGTLSVRVRGADGEPARVMSVEQLAALAQARGGIS